MSALVRFLFVLLSCLLIYPAYAQTALLDPSFGSGGKTIIPFTGTEGGRFEAVAVQTDGKLVVAGNFNNKATVGRFKTDGTPDLSFAVDGFYTSPTSNTPLLDVLLQSDGKIIAVGNTNTSLANNDFMIIRLMPSGAPDATFGASGVAVIDYSGSNDDGYSVALQPDNKIILAGQVISNQTGLARLKADGSLDSSFGTNGKVISTYDWAFYVDVAPDGKIVTGGVSSAAHGYVMTAMRFLTDGSVDTSFNHTGIVYTLAGDPGGNFGRALKVQPDGKILLAGSGIFGSASGNFVALRYNIDGSLDGSFGSGGIANIDFSDGDDAASGICLAPDGKILLAGSTGPGSSKQIAIACLNSDGTLNSSWGNAGKIVTPWRDKSDYGLNIARQADDKIVVVGNSYRNTTSGNYSDPAIARYRPYFTGLPVVEGMNKSTVLYPNPACGQLFIDKAYSGHVNRATAIDAMGKKIDFKIIDACKIDVSEWANGIYLFTLVSDTGSINVHRITIDN